jgi:hypothetical protein
MDKRKLHHLWRKIKPISYWYFFAVFVIFGIIGVFALRQNNLHAIKLREHVNQVDKDNGDIEVALRELREYVYSHMNANLATGSTLQQPIQLKYRYERIEAAEKARVDAANKNILSQAQSECARQFPDASVGGPRVPCINNYVASHGVKDQPIPDELYKFNFVSPRWSADLAGISLLISAFFFILFVFRFGLERWMRHSFKQHL